MNRCRQDALTINMAREQAATPHRSTEEKGGKARSSTNKRKKQTTGGKSTAKGFTLAGNSTPALTHTPSQCCQSAGKKIRLSSQLTHRHRLQFNPTANGIRPQPAAGTQRTRSEQSPKEPHAEAIPHPSSHDAAPHPTRSHGERTVSSTELIRRPSLKDASVIDGP
ncbi:hypothetical protein TcG_08559 [Trypanosoma cruzi]|nr:hypothetical protein TcG_08559 [Trypanosoma cruzi]